MRKKYKAKKKINDNSKARDEKALYVNPMQLIDSMGFKDKPTSITYSLLQQMATRNAVIASIIITRINQVSIFTKPARYSNEHTGFEIRLREANIIPTESQKDVINSIEMFLENCGHGHNSDRDTFDTFIRKIIRDSLTYDQATFEIIPDKLGRPAEFVAVDASTVRVASENYIDNDNNEKVKWVQVIDGTIKTWFTSSELVFGVRNPRSDINFQPYGFSELEQLMHQITSHLYAEEYNSKFFSQGGTTKGILNIRSAANPELIEVFKRQWQAQVSGLTGAWKTPVLQVPEGIDYINVSQSNREMEFEKWMNYLINIACAVYQIDPAEVNFPNNGGVGGKGNSLFDNGSDNKIQNSKDKGLRPLLRFVEDLINRNIISRFSQDYVFNFVGMDAKSEKERLELDLQMIKSYSTVNEIRKKHGLDALTDGDIILDPAYINYILQGKQIASNSNMMNGSLDSTVQDEYATKSLNDYNIMEITIE